ncbi:tRNA dihydrouridine synthase [Azomonas macrocytogenes]|uniref:tRNA-dihydrouridine(16) synthase n=1 Tax=Azomonas macrocytogenes TaxID=69962 RepID=A0A839T6I3_AZOMA|nr:tRNA-dihydrouridine synthase [Azomonas macrocytogenes]MBB3103555.1 tRNA-dihydrouridine synthase C [Azomonas macrocytogenes]
MKIALAPMEGLVDGVLRDVLTRTGGIDWCVTEFIRITDRLLPESSFHKLVPELEREAMTRSGVPVHVQLLGSDPVLLAENAAFAASLGAPVVDLNFGCPTKTVNKSRGGAVLLKEPALLHAIVCEVRRAVPRHIPVTAKMRLGYESPDQAVECAQALSEGGAAFLVVHARTRIEGYRPPAHWEWVARIQDVVPIPVYANGDIWSLDDWRRCRVVSGVENIMLGRGLVSRPDLAWQIAAASRGQPVDEMGWQSVQPMLADFWCQTRQKLDPRYMPGRLKQWLGMLARNYPQALELFEMIRRENDCARIDSLLAEQSVRRGVSPLAVC